MILNKPIIKYKSNINIKDINIVIRKMKYNICNHFNLFYNNLKCNLK